MPDSTTAPSEQKPQKPSPDFPLYAHKSKRWAKKVKYKTEYFGPWDDPSGALEEWYRVKDALLAGRPRPEKRDGAFSVADICNAFLDHRKKRVEQGKMSQRTWNEYKSVAERMIAVFGRNTIADDLKPIDFEPLREDFDKDDRGPKTVHNLITRAMAVVNFANKGGLTETPILTGSYFEKPSAAELRKAQAAKDHKGELIIEAVQIRDCLKEARPQIKAMILLAINVGMGNEDVARLEFRHVDLAGGWLDFPRPKTGVKRKAKLWPETIKALQEVIADRPNPPEEFAEFVFITRYGNVWFKDDRSNPVSREFRNLLKDTGHHVKGIGFYSLRRMFETVASELLDQAAVDLSMGHQSADMAALYRQRLGNDRLEAVAKHVRKWLFGKRGAK